MIIDCKQISIEALNAYKSDDFDRALFAYAKKLIAYKKKEINSEELCASRDSVLIYARKELEIAASIAWIKEH